LGDGGTVTNGSISDTSAVIQGYVGIEVKANQLYLTNFGTIESTGTFESAGVNLIDGGTVINYGSIVGADTGIAAQSGYSTVINQGMIAETAGYGVYLGGGGTITNDSGGTITGDYAGVDITGAVGAVTNLGVIEGTDTGVYLAQGGIVTNGSSGDTSASIGGYIGVLFGSVVGSGTFALYNYGTIADNRGGFGAYFSDGGSVTNHVSGPIEGATGVKFELATPGTVSISCLPFCACE